jgi:non-canonical (house-cleaning) NTP pyrophosphatase
MEIGAVVCGSGGDMKFSALCEALRALKIKSSNIDRARVLSQVNEQPVGLSEMMTGARNRAIGAQSYCLGSFGLGIENGIELSKRSGQEIVHDFAVVDLITPAGKEYITETMKIRFPLKPTVIAKQRGFRTTTVGSVVAEMYGCDPADPHSFLTNGLFPRKQLLQDAIICVFLEYLRDVQRDL